MGMHGKSGDDNVTIVHQQANELCRSLWDPHGNNLSRARLRVWRAAGLRDFPTRVRGGISVDSRGNMEHEPYMLVVPPGAVEAHT